MLDFRHEAGVGYGMSEHVVVDVSEGVLTIRIDRPDKANALTSEMFDAATDALDIAERDTSVRVILMRGMPGVFSAGLDVDDLRRCAEAGKLGGESLRFMKTLATVDKPVVAAVDGLAVGIGTTLLFHCDFIVASEWSIFAAPSVDRGMPPDAGASLLAPMIMGYHQAFELIVMGEQFDAQRAMNSGLINRIVPAEEVDSVAAGYARSLATKPAQVVRRARRLMRGERRDVVARITVEADDFPELLQSPAAHEALWSHIDRDRS